MTENTVSKTFVDFDKFNRKDFADKLTTVVERFYPFADEAYVLSLNGTFGSGKSTFLEMWKNQLEDNGHTVISINAWETDFDNEPIIPIISAILSNLKTGTGVKKLKNSLHGSLGALGLVGNQVLAHATGINVKEAMENVEAELNQTDLATYGKQIYKEYSYKVDAYKKLKEELHNYIQNLDKKPLVIFVDELDRARPNYSIEFLEAIKHIFSVKGIFFVLAVAKDQLEKSVKQHYGDIDFENYYQRFITREVNLPSISGASNIELRPFITSLFNEYIDEKTRQNIKFPWKQNEINGYIETIADICKASDFTPRQIIYFFKIFTQFMAIDRLQIATSAWIDATIILISIYIKNREFYHKIGEAKLSAIDIENYLSELKSQNQNHFICKCIIAFSICENNSKMHKDFVDLFLQYSEIENLRTEEQQNVMITSLRRIPYNSSLSYPVTAYQTIYDKFENWKQFIE